jgi:pimeloyl-ACP methyl ester carboxylesterase
MAGIEMTHVPYRGVGPALNDLLAGRVDVMFGTMTGTWLQAQNGALRALAVSSNTRSPFAQTVAQAAGTALLDRIGQAILVTHSQSGTFGFLIADKRPDLVKGVVTVEGGGTPRGYTAVGAPNWFEDAPVTGGARWGIASIPITYDPPVTDPGQLTTFERKKQRGRMSGAGSRNLRLASCQT